MEPATLPPKPKRRRWRRVIVVAILALMGYWLISYLDWYLMPEDLHRMQGTWSVAQHEVVGQPGVSILALADKLVIERRNMSFQRMELRIDARDGKFSWLGDDAAVIKVFGVIMRLPHMFREPSGGLFGTYEFDADGRLLLWVRGDFDLRRKTKDDMPNGGWKMLLQRE